jgi:putative transposase
MPRIARAIAVGVPHHLTQRGNHRQDVFFTPDDRALYLRWLAEYTEKYQVRLWAYSLMTNHLHLVATPEQELSLALVMRALHSRYTQRQNVLHHWSGHLWQGRFFSTPLDERYFWRAIKYVERNPVRAGLVARAEDYPWSSAGAHCGLATNPLLAALPPEPWLGPDGWSGWLAEEDADDLLCLRAATASGRPCGSPAFITSLTALVGRSMQAQPRGRPRKLSETSNK